MNKTLLILITVLSFGLFGVMGFLTASGEHHAAPTQVSLNGQVESAQQQNFLFIQVDQISERPQLQAVWAVGYFRSPKQTVLTLTPLYPPSNTQSSLAKLGESLSLNPDGSPAQSFIRRASIKNVQYQGYLLLDDEGYSMLDDWLRAQGIPIFTPPPSNQPAFFEAGCGFLRISSTGQYTATEFNWKTFSSHLHTDLPFEELSAAWKGFFDPSHAVNCEVLPN